jgi:hypothetical protein
MLATLDASIRQAAEQSGIAILQSAWTSNRESSWLSAYFCGVKRFATYTDGIDDGEEFSSDVTNSYVVYFCTAAWAAAKRAIGTR